MVWAMKPWRSRIGTIYCKPGKEPPGVKWRQAVVTQNGLKTVEWHLTGRLYFGRLENGTTRWERLDSSSERAIP